MVYHHSSLIKVDFSGNLLLFQQIYMGIYAMMGHGHLRSWPWHQAPRRMHPHCWCVLVVTTPTGTDTNPCYRRMSLGRSNERASKKIHPVVIFEIPHDSWYPRKMNISWSDLIRKQKFTWRYLGWTRLVRVVCGGELMWNWATLKIPCLEHAGTMIFPIKFCWRRHKKWWSSMENDTSVISKNTWAIRNGNTMAISEDAIGCEDTAEVVCSLTGLEIQKGQATSGGNQD